MNDLRPNLRRVFVIEGKKISPIHAAVVTVHILQLESLVSLLEYVSNTKNKIKIKLIFVATTTTTTTTVTQQQQQQHVCVFIPWKGQWRISDRAVAFAHANLREDRQWFSWRDILALVPHVWHEF
jgi:hypothetical protein